MAIRIRLSALTQSVISSFPISVVSTLTLMMYVAVCSLGHRFLLIRIGLQPALGPAALLLGVVA